MKKKFFKNLFEKENNLQMYSINEFNVFKDIISFSKLEVYKEMKLILNDINKKIDKQMEEIVEKYHIVMGLKKQTDEMSLQLTGEEEEIDVLINNSKEADIIARYSEKMLYKLLEVGFDSSDRELEKKAMTVTYSKRIMMKLDNIAKKDPSFNENIDTQNETTEFEDIEEKEEIKFEKLKNDAKEKLNNETEILKEKETLNDKTENHTEIEIQETNELNKNNSDEGETDMKDEKYSKEAYDLLVKGENEEVDKEIENLSEEAYDVLIKETEDDVLRKNEDTKNVSEEVYEEFIKKDRKIREVENDEY